MRKISLLLLFILTVSVPFVLVGKDIQLKIPVRISFDKEARDLEKKDIQLYINGSPRQVEQFIKKNRSINDTVTRRSFCLAFNITDYSHQVSEGIEYFVRNVLREDDRLMLWSPVKKVYRVNTRKKKEEIITDIEKLIKDDSLVYKKNLEVTRQNLEYLIKTIGMNVTQIKQFVNAYLREINNLKTRYLLPNLDSYAGLLSLMGADAGEKWIINIQEREIIPCIKKFRDIKNKIRSFLSTLAGDDQAWASSISSGLNLIDKAMLLSDQFPLQGIQDLMQGINVNYNVVFFTSMRKTSTEGTNNTSPDYEELLRKISNSTGGIAEITNDLKEGLGKISANNDQYYDLVFTFNGKVEEKEIEVKLNEKKKKDKIFYMSRFLEDEVKALTQAGVKKALGIVKYKLSGHKLAFRIEGYKMDKDEKAGNKNTGILTIQIKLFDDKNNILFKAGKTFKSPKDFFDISLGLPAKHKGYFKLSIAVEDMRTGGSAELNKYVKLK